MGDDALHELEDRGDGLVRQHGEFGRMRTTERREVTPDDRVTNRSPRHRRAQMTWKTARYATYSDTIATGNSSSKARNNVSADSRYNPNIAKLHTRNGRMFFRHAKKLVLSAGTT